MQTDILLKYGKAIRQLRQKKGISQEELANRLNVSRQTISKWEVGESTPDMENLVAISELFEISLDELVLNKVPEEADTSAQVVKSEFYSDIKENVLTDENRKKAKKGLKIASIVLGIIFLIDLISFVIYVLMNGFPH